jgi:hypothetical protein
MLLKINWLPVSDSGPESNLRDEMYSNRQKADRVNVHSVNKLRRFGEKDAFLQHATKPSGTIDKQII